ncbi:hypothetical protein G7078_07005 [Sphingomonas sinipercae]|uniref:CAAX prenyl protease 2/Lysostaphin resistance protein A-like domain-containing protein n=1 Tax=Sphingomonas sinipercae TaxID=2714944 RepID=A0A6G7ZNK9_9SPHN|nr:CPBP family glutamic-type intramembrane protease [Sphingomonas sinipercae]QIL02561.1 hypothetical protein G7078_07005 [Sphingomonas sinipercae]
MPDQLLKPRDPLIAIGAGWLVSFPISMVLALIASTLVDDAAAPVFPMRGIEAIFALVIFAPVVETLAMGVVLLLLQRLVRPEIAVAISAVGWGLLHAAKAPVWGFIIWWPFLVFSTLFITWRQRSLLLAFLIPMAVHALQNLLPALLVSRGMTP